MYEQFVSDKPGAENRSFESPVLNCLGNVSYLTGIERPVLETDS
jgi:hypothetical protein